MTIAGKRIMTSASAWFNLTIILVFAGLYIGGRLSPVEQKFVWSFNFLIPAALIVNIFLIVLTLFYNRPLSIVYTLLLALGSNYLFSSFGIKGLLQPAKDASKSFSIQNFNVSSLYTLSTEVRENLTPNSRAIQIKDWILGNNSDIQCYQEFLSVQGHKDFDIIKKLEDAGYQTFFSKSGMGEGQNQAGLLIASRFPIVGKGELVTHKANHQFHFNRIMYVDLKIQEDTVRVINFHLASMALKTLNPLMKASFVEKVDNTKEIFERLKDGVVDRSLQVRDMIDFIKNSPYRVICAGDLNDLPYTYSYQQMKKVLSNAFEDRGKGFGFTYNGNLLRTLRIDNQFYSSGISPLAFETLYKVDCSDHFPVVGRYEVVGKKL